MFVVLLFNLIFQVSTESPSAGIYLLKVSITFSRHLLAQSQIGKARTMCEICSNLTIKIPERRRRRSGVFIVNFEHILHIVLVFPFLTLHK